MAQVYQLPQAPNTSIGRLGDVILGSAVQYAGEKRADDREARIRQERLADVADERQYSESREAKLYSRNRADRLADIKDERAYSEKEKEMAMLREMERLGYLARGLRDNPDAVAEAYQRVAADGTAARYKSAVDSGALSWGAILSGDVNAINAGLLAATKLARDNTTRVETQRANAQRAADTLGERDLANEAEARKLLQEMQQAQAELETPSEPTSDEVVNMATRLAAQSSKTPGKPTKEETAQHVGPAIETLRNIKLQNASIRFKSAHEQLAAVRNMSAGYSSRLNVMGAQGAFPSLSETPTAAPAPTAVTEPAPKLGPGGFMEAVRAQIAAGKQPPPTAAAGVPSSGNFGFGGVGMSATAGRTAPTGAPPTRSFGIGGIPVAAPASVPDWVPAPVTSAQPTPSLAEPAPAPARSNLDRMRNLELSPWDIITGNTPSSPLAEISTDVYRANELREKLSRIADKTHPEAQRMQQLLFELERRLSQKTTQGNKEILVDPVISTPFDTAPRRMMDSRLFEPAL